MQTQLFGELQANCFEEVPTQCKCSDWISEESSRLIANQAMLRRTGHLCQAGGHRLHRQIGAMLRKDSDDCTEQVGRLSSNPNSWEGMFRRPSAI